VINLFTDMLQRYFGITQNLQTFDSSTGKLPHHNFYLTWEMSN